MTKSSENVRRMVLCAMFTALVAVCSQIAVPMPWGVPINLALFAVYMAGTMLGPVWGTASQVVFIALAAIGVPVLANFQGGPSAIFGKTGGYAIGYILTALLTALLTKALGRKFDIRKFHDAGLLSGGTPLTVLDQVIDNYIASAR